MFGGGGVLKEEKLNQYIIITACGYDLMNNMFTKAELLTAMYHVSCNRSNSVSSTSLQHTAERRKNSHVPYWIDIQMS